MIHSQWGVQPVLVQSTIIAVPVVFTPAAIIIAVPLTLTPADVALAGALTLTTAAVITSVGPADPPSAAAFCKVHLNPWWVCCRSNVLSTSATPICRVSVAGGGMPIFSQLLPELLIVLLMVLLVLLVLLLMQTLL